MPDLSILNILIAMVIVILVLSLVVQSLQTLTKKIFKLKSKSILNSLEDLFETVTQRPVAEGAAVPGPPSKTPQQLVNDVTNTLKEMGRKSLFGKPMFDSLAKGDLLKILTRVKAEDLLPGAVVSFQAVLSGIQTLKDEIGKIETNLLQGEASAKFAAMQGSIMPLLHDLEALASGGNIDPAVFFGDLYKVRQIKAAEVLDILGQVQQGVNRDLVALETASGEAHKALAEAKASNNQERINLAETQDAQATGNLEAVEKVDAGLKTIAKQIAALSTAFDAAFAPLFARLQQVEAWYDTVMQGFEERYTRHMRTVGIVISIGVVVVLNANFFSIYRAMKADPERARLIAERIEKNPGILKQEENKPTEGANKPAATATPLTTPTASPSPAGSPSAGIPSGASSGPNSNAAGSTPGAVPSPTESPVTVEEIKKEAANVGDLINTYESFGLKPLSREQIRELFTSEKPWNGLIETLLGWAIMVMLLSAGAPFWQDTLESLFGLKNLLRQRSNTKNIEDEKGGQPKP